MLFRAKDKQKMKVIIEIVIWIGYNWTVGKDCGWNRRVLASGSATGVLVVVLACLFVDCYSVQGTGLLT
jgi:hypothetical protein